MIAPLQIHENTQNEKLSKASQRMQALIDALNKKQLSAALAAAINQEVQSLAQSSDNNQNYTKKLEAARSRILKQAEKDGGYVARHHYRKLWLALGLASFGITIGVIFSMLLDNMAYLGTGFPFGMAIGAAVGTRLDKKAEAEGKTLDVE